MKAARLHGIGDLRLADEPVPEPEPGETLVKVTAVGICGSDLHWWGEAGIGDARLAQPLVLGHEAAGVIADGPERGRRAFVRRRARVFRRAHVVRRRKPRTELRWRRWTQLQRAAIFGRV